jgi:proline racemase
VTAAPTSIRTVDYHAGGQPLRIVVEGGPPLEGTTAAERRASAIEHPHLDAFRTFLCEEPRGHADMYVAYLFESADPECDFGAVFGHGIGYPPSCGHGTLALAAYAVEAGLVEAAHDGETVVTIEVPAGRAGVRVVTRDGVVRAVRVNRGPSYPVLLDQRAQTSRGPVDFDLVFSGATFASVDVGTLGLSIEPDSSGQLKALAAELAVAVAASAPEASEANPQDERLDGVFGIILFEDLEPVDGRMRQRAVNIFNGGWMERSPGAAMTGARLALLRERGHLGAGESFIQESISGARAIASVDADQSNDSEVFIELETSAHRTGEHEFVADPRDGVVFSLR